MKRLLALLLGGLGLRALLRRRPAVPTGPSPADELRARLAAARVDEPEAEVEEAPLPPLDPTPEEVPGTEVPGTGTTVEERRADVHARARQALDELKQ